MPRKINSSQVEASQVKSDSVDVQYLFHRMAKSDPMLYIYIYIYVTRGHFDSLDHVCVKLLASLKAFVFKDVGDGGDTATQFRAMHITAKKICGLGKRGHWGVAEFRKSYGTAKKRFWRVAKKCDGRVVRQNQTRSARNYVLQGARQNRKVGSSLARTA